MFEFMKCEIDSSDTVFSNHKCGNSNSPSINTLSNFITNNLKISKSSKDKLLKLTPFNYIGLAKKLSNLSFL